MYICLCKAITDSQIREAVANGPTRFGHVLQELGLASQCGKCGILTRQIVRETLSDSTDNEQLFYAVS